MQSEVIKVPMREENNRGCNSTEWEMHKPAGDSKEYPRLAGIAYILNNIERLNQINPQILLLIYFQRVIDFHSSGNQHIMYRAIFFNCKLSSTICFASGAWATILLAPRSPANCCRTFGLLYATPRR